MLRSKLKILVTAGPTREPLDPVRYISNRSSGRMGYAIAAAAAKRGHAVCLISGPTALQPPGNVNLVNVLTASEMETAVLEQMEWCDVLVMAAAVSDWCPAEADLKKIKKHDGSFILTLQPTTDILKSIKSCKGGRLFIGFAAETDNLLENASLKLHEKGLDFILANDVSRQDIGFDVKHNQIVLLGQDGLRENWPRMLKTGLANRLIKFIEVKRGVG